MNSAQKYRNNRLAKTLYKYTPKFINEVIFSLFGFIKYFEYLELKKTHLSELKKNERLERFQIKEIQEKKLRKIIIHAYKNTEYYKILIDDSAINPYNFTLKDLNKLPVLTKEILLENKDRLIASNHEDYSHVGQSSGGTTGTTINFLMDKENYLFKEAEVLLFWERHGYIPRKTKGVMYRAGVLFSDDGKVPKKPWRIDYGRNLLYLSSYYSSDEYYQKYYLKLKKWKPEFMHVLPSAGYLFANYLNENNLSINFKKVFTASEMLYPSHKEAMEKAFNCKVVEHYGHGEPGIYAAGECEYKNFHLCETNTIVEQGLDGSIIETSLNNFSMPFIRYKVGDRIKKIDEENCKCGLTSSYITGIIGRDSEVIYTGDGRKISSIGFDQIFKDNNIKMGQIVQEEKGVLHLNIVPQTTFNSNNKESLLTELKSRVGKKTVVIFNKVENIKIAKSGKYNLIISKLKGKIK
jgi:phenylacetate-CoA ligase